MYVYPITFDVVTQYKIFLERIAVDHNAVVSYRRFSRPQQAHLDRGIGRCVFGGRAPEKPCTDYAQIEHDFCAHGQQLKWKIEHYTHAHKLRIYDRSPSAIIMGEWLGEEDITR